jgi:hypothetical protein
MQLLNAVQKSSKSFYRVVAKGDELQSLIIKNFERQET